MLLEFSLIPLGRGRSISADAILPSCRRGDALGQPAATNRHGGIYIQWHDHQWVLGGGTERIAYGGMHYQQPALGNRHSKSRVFRQR